MSELYNIVDASFFSQGLPAPLPAAPRLAENIVGVDALFQQELPLGL